MFVPAGSRLTWAGDFGKLAFFAQSSGDAISWVGTYLKNNYNLVVERANDGVGGFANVSGGTITLDLLTNMDRGNGSDGIEDIRGNVDDAFANGWGSVGSAVSASRIIKMNLVPSKAGQPIVPAPNLGPQDTGAPTEPPVAPPSPPKPCSGFWDCIGSGSVGDAFDQLKDQVEAGTIGLVIGAAVVIGLVLWLSVKSAAT